MRIRLHLKIFIFILIFLLTKQIAIYGIMMLFALIHELGHLFIGILLRFKPVSLDIMPYGLSIGFEINVDDYNKKIKKANLLAVKKIIIAIAGPLTNLIIVLISLLTNIKMFGIEQELVIYSNILIGLFNLIPIYPLDGGRIIKNVIYIFFGLQKSYDYTYMISRITICILTAICSVLILYIRNISILIILAYLWYLIIIEEKKYRKRKNIMKQAIL